jgi:hypothetical protein
MAAIIPQKFNIVLKHPCERMKKRKMNFVVEQYTKHTNGELSTVDFVRSVGYKYAARTDI